MSFPSKKVGYDFSVTHYDSGSHGTSDVVKASGGSVVSVHGLNLGDSTRYFQLFNARAVPADTAVPAIAPVKVAAGAEFSFSFVAPIYFDDGICWASSSTAGTKTESGAVDLWVTISFG